MLKTVQKRIEELHMISPGDMVLVGVSGGADSICLLLVLAALKESLSFSLEVVHIEHGIRGEESKADAVFVQETCKRIGISCHTEYVDVPGFCEETGLGIEEGARILRYREFTRLAQLLKAKVALAHNIEDNAETVLFQMARGSSLAGLCGMQPMREDEQGVTYIRPLLSIHRKQIEEFLQGQGMEYRTDSTNAQLDYSRNFIRKEILPGLQTINAQAVEHIQGAAESLSEIKDYLAFEVEKAWSQVLLHVQQEDEVGATALNACSVRLNIDKLLGLHKVLQKEIIYRAIAEVSGGKKDIATVHVIEVLGLCENQSGKRISLPNEIEARRDFDSLCLYKKEQIVPEEGANSEETSTEDVCMVSRERLQRLFETKEALEIPLLAQGGRLTISILGKKENSGEIPQKTYTKWFDYDKIKTGFCIRTRKSGDYLISDVFGHRKKLKQYFIEEKIAVEDRAHRWLLAQDSLIFWVVGGRMSEHVKITEDTKTIVEITYDGGI